MCILIAIEYLLEYRKFTERGDIKWLRALAAVFWLDRGDNTQAKISGWKQVAWLYSWYHTDNFYLHTYRNPAPSSRPIFRDILEAMLQDETKVLQIPVDDASTNELASILGSPLEAGECMYMDLQQEYMLPNEDRDKNSDYEVITDELDESLKSGE